MLSNTLNTNEIKNSAGTEQEFQRITTGPGRSTEFSLITEAPAYEHRLLINHQEIGTGIRLRRRSRVGFIKNVASTVDPTYTAPIIANFTLDAPIGALLANTEMVHVVANMLSFCASLGASTTILYDGTGNGAQVLLTGGL
jgi:hypothetical protein